MADRNLALNLLIKAKDLASGVVKRFRGEVKDAGADADQLSDSLDKTGRKTREFSESVDQASQSSSRLYGDTRGRRFWQRFSEGAADASTKTKKFKGDLNELPNAADNAGRGISGLTSKVVALAGTYLGLNALKNAIAGLVNVGSRFEDMQVQLNTLMGSIEEGEKATAWIKEFAKTTPADIEGVTQGFIRLKAFGIDPMDGSYQAIIDQTSKLGFSQEKMEGVILAVGQAWTKQKLQGEEALQLIERGVPVWDLLAKATGKTTVELQKMSEQGQLGRREIALLIQEMGKSSEGAAAEAMKTWTGLVSNLKDMWLNFVNDINEAGFLDYMKQQLQELLDTVKQMAADGSLKRWAKEISDGLIAVADGFKSVITFTVNWGKELLILAGAIAGLKLLAFGRGLLTIATNMGKAAAATTGMTAATNGLAAAQARVSGGWGWLKSAGGGLKRLGGYLLKGGRLLTGIGLLSIGVKEVADRWRESEKAANDALSAMQQRSIKALDEQAKYLDYQNVQLKTEEELARISRQGYDAYLERLQGAQQYWQARVAEEQAEIEQGRNRQTQMEEAKAQLETYIEAEGRLKQQITDVNTLKDQELSLGVAGAEQHTQQTGTKIAELGEIGSLQQQLNEQRQEQLTAEQEAFKALGLSMEEVTGQITQQGEAAVQAFATIVESGNYTSEQVQAAFNAALSQTTTKADLEALIETLRNSAVEGENAGIKIMQAFDKALEDAETEEEVLRVMEGLKAVGETSEDSGRRVEGAMRKAKGKLEELRKAAKGAGDSIKDVGDEAAAAKKDIDDLGKALDDSAKKGKGGMESLTKEIKVLIGVVQDLTKEFQKAGEEADTLAKKTKAAKDAASDGGSGDGDSSGAKRYVSPAEGLAWKLAKEDPALEQAVWAVINQGGMKKFKATGSVADQMNSYYETLERKARAYLDKQRQQQMAEAAAAEGRAIDAAVERILQQLQRANLESRAETDVSRMLNELQRAGATAR